MSITYSSELHIRSIIPLIPTEGAPAATAASAYSICTSLPDGLQLKIKTNSKHFG